MKAFVRLRALLANAKSFEWTVPRIGVAIFVPWGGKRRRCPMVTAAAAGPIVSRERSLCDVWPSTTDIGIEEQFR